MPARLDGVTLYSHGARLLGALFRPGAAGPVPAVLLLHGIPGVEKNFDLAYALREAGWNVLAIHYRGCWGSEGVYSLPGILDDITAAVDYLCQHPGVDARRLAGVGLSLGGWGVIAAAARDERLRAVVALNPLVDGKARSCTEGEAAEYASMLNGVSPAEVQSQWAALTPLPQVAGRLAGRPVLLLTGDADALFPPEHQRPLAEALPRETAEWRRIPGADHIFADHRGIMIRAVVEWLVRAFSPFPPLPPGLALRSPVAAEHGRVLAAIEDWSGGKEVARVPPRPFFGHFADASFVVEKGADLVAYLAGFLSPSEPRKAWIYYMAVHPAHRRAGLGRALCERFFELARARGAREVRCAVAPGDPIAMAFHMQLGFVAAEPSEDFAQPGQIVAAKLLG